MIEKTLDNKKYYELTDEECKNLLKLGEEAMKNIYTGVSYLSDTETLTMHSEATALAHAAIHGEKDIVAITGPNCHICKQLIYESGLRSGIDVVVVIGEDNQIKQIPISKMMPYPWPEKLQDEKTD